MPEETKTEEGPRVADLAVKKAIEGYESCLRYKRKRLEQIKLANDEYNNIIGPALAGRFNVPVPVVSGFVETLLSKIDDKPTLNFERQREGSLKIAKQVTAAWEIDASDEEGDWSEEDGHAKKNAIFEGAGIYKKWTDSYQKFTDYIEAVSLFDFIFDIRGGNNLERHRLLGQDNIEKTKEELEGEPYDQEQVAKLLLVASNDDYLNGTGEYADKIKKYDPFGSEPDAKKSDVYRLCEMGVEYQGKRWYLLFDYKSGIWVRAGLWKEEISKSDLWMWTAFHTHPQRDKFLTKAPVDDILPVAEATRILFNQALDNLEKRNWDMKAFDEDLVTDPQLLVHDRSNKLVPIAASRKGRSLSDAVYQFTTPDSTMITIRLMDFLNAYWGRQSGVTPDVQGSSEEKRVGILVSNIQQVADRLGYTNKQYVRAWKRLGLRYIWGLKEHMSQKRLVKVIGTKGAEWNELLRKEVDVGMAVVVRSGRAELEQDELNQKRRTESLIAVAGNPILVREVNPTKVTEEILRSGNYEDEDIRQFFDKETYGDRELMSEAAAAIEEIIDGKTPKLNRGANTAFMQKIIDFAINTDTDEDTYKKLMQYAESHTVIAAENMARKAQGMLSELRMRSLGFGAEERKAERITALPEPVGREGGMPTPRIPNAPSIRTPQELAGVG